MNPIKFLGLLLVLLPVRFLCADEANATKPMAQDCLVSGAVTDWVSTYCKAKAPNSVQRCIKHAAKEVPASANECEQKAAWQKKYCALPSVAASRGREKDDICLRGKIE